MRGRRPSKYCPALERLERKELPSTSALAAPVAHHLSALTTSSAAATDVESSSNGLPTRFLAYRITLPSYPDTVNLNPPFQHVLVQNRQPIPGQVYNVLQVAVKNGTNQTFHASNGFTVRMTNQTKAHAYPILTGNEVWKPNTWIVFYILTKKYYPVQVLSGGFQLNLGGASSTLVPGPSGIFLRLKYDPATFGRTLDWIVAYGQGAQTGNGPPVGLPDSAINEIVAARTRRMDFAGHF
jgi:hypothetical protein